MGAPAMALVIAMVLTYLGVYGLPFKAATPGLGYWPSQQVNQAAFAISNGVPAGGALGLAVQYGMLSSHGVAPAVATSAITAVGIWSTFVSLGFPILGVAAIAVSGSSGSAHVATAVLGLGILIAAVVDLRAPCHALAIARRADRPPGQSAHRPARRSDSSAAGVDLVGPLTSFRTSMYDLLKRRWRRSPLPRSASRLPSS
jgi:hypothetical protein